MIVTTAYNPSQELIARSKELAKATGSLWFPRRRYSIAQLKGQNADLGLLVLTDEKLLLYPKDQEEAVFFHPSTAYIRVKRMQRGESDPMITASGAEAGDTVIDCTAGLASDSIVFSHAVGPKGCVIALESELSIITLLKEGLGSLETQQQAVNEAMRRIRLVHADHLAYLSEQPDQSVDIVYFDPMFRIPVEESSAISPFRSIANPSPLSEDSIREAKRIARKRVVLKEHRDSPEFERLGFHRYRTRTKISYGVIVKEGEPL